MYIERDIPGQDDKKDGLWLSDYYILDTDTNEPYVWAANDKNRLEKRYVTLGKHDDSLGEYEIVDGLTKKDAIAFPTDSLEEGEKTEIGDLPRRRAEEQTVLLIWMLIMEIWMNRLIRQIWNPAQTALQSRIWRKIPQTQQMTVQKI